MHVVKVWVARMVNVNVSEPSIKYCIETLGVISSRPQSTQAPGTTANGYNKKGKPNKAAEDPVWSLVLT